MFCFESRRRHTRLVRDWSSDVCSSDLITGSPAHLETQTKPQQIRSGSKITVKQRQNDDAQEGHQDRVG
mgnify:CR=1 FL=1